MKTILSFCTDKVFARGWLPMASLSPHQVAAKNDNNETGSLSTRAAWTAGLHQRAVHGSPVRGRS
jgi:hypothetical protein